jgi:hypothetical protein
MNNTAINPLIQTVGYNNYSTDHHRFVLCESCFWSATIFKSDKKQEQIINTCPVCFNDRSISLIPLVKEEVYELSLSYPKGGLDIKFSKLIKSTG